MSRSIVGFHYSTGGNKTGIGDFMRKLNDAKVPFLLKGSDEPSLCFEGQELGKLAGVENYLIYRVSTAGQRRGGVGVEYDVPDYLKSPHDAAGEHFEKTAVKWPRELDKSIVWMEPLNKPRAKVYEGDRQFNDMHPVDWLGEFMLEYAKIANEQGFKVCGPSFDSGEPEVFASTASTASTSSVTGSVTGSATGNDYEQPGMLAYLRYCADNPTKAALSVHEYTWDRDELGQQWADWYPHLWGRVEAALAAADNHRIPRDFSIFVTEWGFSATHAPRWPYCEPYLTAYNQWAARWRLTTNPPLRTAQSQIKGAAAWSLQGGRGSVDSDLQSWLGPLADYAVSREFDPGSQPAMTHARFGSTLPD